MAVIETPSLNSDDIIVHMERRKKADRFTNRQRKGVNARSGILSMTDKAIGEIEQPTVDKAPALIKHLRIIGKTRKGERPEDVLTAQGAALYEFLMASARIQGFDRIGEFRVSFTDAKKYLEIEHNKRLIELADQLRETQVEYDFRLEGFERWGKMPLLFTDFGRDKDGKMHLIYSIHLAVKRVLLERDQYTKLEINAFARFSCKYTSRIYPRLAMMAGYHEAYRKPWKITPLDLAKMIGFTFTGEFHFGNFEKGCLKKVMHDIEQHVLRFDAKLTVHRKVGRGNPVDFLEFTTSSAAKHVLEHAKQPMSPDEYKALNKELREDETQSFYEMPSAEVLRAGATKTGYSPSELLNLWKQALEAANAYPTMVLPEAGLLTGAKLLERRYTISVGAACELWLTYFQAKTRRVIPERKEDTIWDTILRVILADPETALDYCDPDHPEWTKVQGKLTDGDRKAFVAALEIMASPVVEAGDRDRFFTSIIRAFKDGKPDETSMMIGKISDYQTRKYRSSKPINQPDFSA